MPRDSRDPLEERDILKILDALEDERVIKKIAGLLQIKTVKMSLEGPGGAQSLPVNVTVIVPREKEKSNAKSGQ